MFFGFYHQLTLWRSDFENCRTRLARLFQKQDLSVQKLIRLDEYHLVIFTPYYDP